MSLFQEIKQHVTARQIAESYGLKVSSRGMACCPFHDDRHPSLKVDETYYCFGCGAHGDAVGFVAQMEGLSQYEAACKIVQDFNLPVNTGYADEAAKAEAWHKWKKEKQRRERDRRTRERFRRWCNRQIDTLKTCEQAVEETKARFAGSSPEVVFMSKEYALAVMAEPMVSYWLDILCLGDESEKEDLFINGRKEVDRIVERIDNIRKVFACADRNDSGQRIQQCG